LHYFELNGSTIEGKRKKRKQKGNRKGKWKKRKPKWIRKKGSRKKCKSNYKSACI